MCAILTNLKRDSRAWSSLFDNLCNVRAIYTCTHPETFINVRINAIDYGNIESLCPHRLMAVYYVYEYNERGFDEVLEAGSDVYTHYERVLECGLLRFYVAMEFMEKYLADTSSFGMGFVVVMHYRVS
jgi:hypothetical protein